MRLVPRKKCASAHEAVRCMRLHQHTSHHVGWDVDNKRWHSWRGSAPVGARL